MPYHTCRVPPATLHPPRSTRHAPPATLHPPRSTRHAPPATLRPPRSARRAPPATGHATDRPVTRHTPHAHARPRLQSFTMSSASCCWSSSSSS
eukprot:94316-Prymnesium_polylepis.1